MLTIIDKTLITICNERADFYAIKDILEGLIGAGVKTFEVNKDTLQYLINICNESQSKDILSILKPVSLAYRLCDDSKYDRHEQVSVLTKTLSEKVEILIIPVKDILSFDPILLSKLKNIMVEVSVADFFELFKQDNWQQLKQVVRRYGVSVLRLSGLQRTVLPLYENYIMLIKKELQVKINVCARNDAYTATAISFNAVEQGVDSITTHINGGMSSQYTPLEEIVMSLTILSNQEYTGIKELSFIQTTAKAYEQATGNKIAHNKPIIGDGIFKYESGVHADGIAKNHATYEPYAPEFVGQNRKLLLGKHSGCKSLQTQIKKWKIPLTCTQIPILLETIRNNSINLKRSICDEELLSMIKQIESNTC
ncbi:homocitrate synthase/isopropylmalate synthase family protein [Desulfuribacillus alkaliarsenatis]|uniref:2-isopropylmalate synthase/homocitrate synthase post-catalytic domain-containing protein n=1 Tax=Desulfuribacillus alkaliarsenatis TaxID=766136 RepID=A0A1E5G0J3_9FIRM|nr:hypothetical protein [Desulfuribacillus alkaliarsenatis]OEF96263.1 hypothetical protein BHF68_08870 [Desulfuribacillus alkaliarsenatis]